MTSIARRLRLKSLFQKPWPPINLPTSRPEILDNETWLEEEQFEDFRVKKKTRFFPVNIGDVYESRYQVVGKLGFGSTSTVWLARDLEERRHVSLKVFARGGGLAKNEFEVYRKLKDARSAFTDQTHVRTAWDLFSIEHEKDSHHVLVQEPMWDDFRSLLHRNPAGRLPETMLKLTLIQIFKALDYLHSECNLIHTDIKADNMFVGIGDKSLFDGYIEGEIREPAPRKVVNGLPVYMSRRFGVGRGVGMVYLGDFGSAVSGQGVNTSDAQPNVYRCPEMMLRTEWSYPADIWNVGAMIWDLFEGKHLFYGRNDPNGMEYTTRAHLAEVIGLLGPPPLDLLKRGKRSPEFFTDDGDWIAPIKLPIDASLEASEERLDGENKRAFLRFMRSMLQWRPEDRKTAKELLDDPWLNAPCDNSE